MTITTQPQSFEQYEADCQKFVSEFKSDNPTVIVQYVRSRNRERKGVIIAFRGLRGEIWAGFSLCNVKRERRGFSPIIGLRKAIDRSRPIDDIRLDQVPHGARATLAIVCERAREYFS